MLECQPHLAELYQTGQVIMDAGLELETMSLHRADDEVTTVSDRSLAATEKIGSVFVIEAQDKHDTIRLASLHPTTRIDAGEQFGWRIEIRTWVLAQTFPSFAIIGPRSPGEIASTLPALGISLSNAEVLWLNLESELVQG